MVLVPSISRSTVSEQSIVGICFNRATERQLNRDAVFAFSLSATTTASLGSDFLFDPPANITIPAGSTIFSQCFNVVFQDDALVEYDEIVDFVVAPFNELDRVAFSVNTPSLLITIEDDDGKFSIISMALPSFRKSSP